MNRQVVVVFIAAILPVPATAKDKTDRPAPMDVKTIRAFEKLGGEYWQFKYVIDGGTGSKGIEPAGILEPGYCHMFKFEKLPAGALPESGVPYGLIVENPKGLKRFAQTKNLRYLSIEDECTDEEFAEACEFTGLWYLVLDRQPKLSESGLAGIAKLKELKLFHVHKSECSDTIAKILGGMKSLSSIGLNNSKITDKGVADLAALHGLRELDLSGTGAGDACVPALLKLKALTAINVGYTKISAKAIKEFGQLPALSNLLVGGEQIADQSLLDSRANGFLHKLSICDREDFARPRKEDEIYRIGLGGFNTKISHRGLKSLWGLKNLRILNVSGSECRDEGLKAIRPLTSLTELDITLTKCTDRGLKELAELKRIEVLHLSINPITDKGLAELQQLSELKMLWISDTGVTDAGMKHLRNFKKLETLWMQRTKVGDAGLKEIKSLGNLDFLDLSETRVTDKGLMELAVLSKMKTLRLKDTKVTSEGIEKFKKALPDCEVEQ